MENIMYQGRYMKVTEEFIEGNNWERCYLRDGVIVFAIDNDGKFILIRERRPHEIEPIRLRFVAGHIEPELTIEENALKELREEINICAKNVEKFFEIRSSGTVNNTVSFVLATGLTPDPNPIVNPDGDVILSIEKYSYSEVMDLIMNDRLRWSSAVLGFFRLHHLNQDKLIIKN